MPWIKRERVDANSADFDVPRVERISEGAVVSVNDDEAVQFLTEFNKLLNKFGIERRLGTVIDTCNSEVFLAGGRILDAVHEWAGDEERNIYCEVAVLKRIPGADGDELTDQE